MKYKTSVLFFCFLCFLDLYGTNHGLSKISARNKANNKDFAFFADLIVWTAKEAGADCWAEVIVSDTTMFSNDILEVHFGWEIGFRVGLGYEIAHNQWNTKVYYTRFHTVGNDLISSKPGTVHSTFLGNFYVNNPSGFGLSGPAYQKASIHWAIHYNMFDWELAHSCRISKWVILQPFLGIKGGWIDQSIDSQWENPDLVNPAFFAIGMENLTNNFWGIGPKAGVNTQWILFGNKSPFYLFGYFSGALMWGYWSFGDVFQNDLPQQVCIDLQDIISGASMLQTFVGFGWDANFKANKYRFSLKFGYEMQFWLDQLQYYSFTGGRLVNVLTLQGGTFALCFAF